LDKAVEVAAGLAKVTDYPTTRRKKTS